jgi:hypothetical protein
MSAANFGMTGAQTAAYDAVMAAGGTAADAAAAAAAAEAVGSATAATGGLSSADKAALLSDAGYGANMTGAQTAAYDAVIANGGTATDALAAADAAAKTATAATNTAATTAATNTAATTAATNAAATTAATAATAAANPFNFIIPAAASLLGGYMQGQSAKDAAEVTASASTRAAELQREAQREALALQTRMYDEAVARQQPYYQAGTNALAQMQGRTNAMPPAFQFRPDQLTTDPGYGFRFSEGLKALERSAAARGGLLSGGTGKALTRYGQEAASQEYGNAFNRGLTEYNALRQREGEEYNRLAGLAGVGGTTAQQLTAAGQNYGTSAGNLLTGTASNIGNLMVGQGNTAANALLASGSAYQRSAGDIASLYARMYGPQPTYLMPGGGG